MRTYQYLEDFISLLYPDCCNGCGENLIKGEEVLCSRCRIKLPKTYNYKEPVHPLKLRISTNINFRHVFSYLRFTKSGTTQNLLHKLKYNNAKEVGICLGKMYGSELAENGFGKAFDRVLPIPLHNSRLKKRGYNQSEIAAIGLCQYLSATLSPETVSRMKATHSQTKYSGQKRWQNVKDVFKVNHPKNIEGQNILLVDDIITTGATIESLALEIAKYKPQSISVLVLAEA